jgi:hypothetical protein
MSNWYGGRDGTCPLGTGGRGVEGEVGRRARSAARALGSPQQGGAAGNGLNAEAGRNRGGPEKAKPKRPIAHLRGERLALRGQLPLLRGERLLRSGGQSEIKYAKSQRFVPPCSRFTNRFAPEHCGDF